MPGQGLLRARRLWGMAALSGAVIVLLWAAGAARAATLTVTTTTDGDDGTCTASKCTLRDAIKYSSAGDTVMIPAASAPYALTLGELFVGHNLTIDGAGAGSVTISGSNLFRVFEIQANVTLSGVTITDGNGTGGTFVSDGDGGAIAFSSGTDTLSDSVVSNSTGGQEGGGIFVEATITVQDSTITGNSSPLGGGVAVENQMTLTGSTINANHATLSGFNTGLGGGIYNDDTVFATNSTITGNTADVQGGGIYSEATTLTNATVASNSSPDGANNFINDTTSGGYQNTIVANPQGGGANCDTAGLLPPSNGNNINSDSSSCWATNQSSDQTGVNPDLGPLTDNGGPTQTMALLAGSPAIDKGATVLSVTTDQRGVTRPQGPAYDIGAFEVQVSADMGISKSGSPDPATVGQTLVYTLTATNHGPGSAPGVTVTDTLPSSVTFQSASASQGSCSNSSGTVTCDLGNLAAGASATSTINVTPNSAGEITNTASVKSSAPDSDSSNDTATVVTQVQSAPAAGKPQAKTGGASGLTFTSATLHGKVNAGGAASTFFFEYGTSKRYGSKTSSRSAGSGTTFRSFSRAVSGLRSGTLYHYRIVARNSRGTARGVDRTFRTPRRPALHVRPSQVVAGATVRVFGNAGGCPRGDQVTLLSRAFSRRHEFAGEPAVFARVGRGGSFSTTTRIPRGRSAGRYGITGRCGGGNLGVSALLTVRAAVVPVFTG
jgi:uncharacterized repeat protein (TIGR01451 family)/CSLREA domain-containing protein